MTNQYADFPFDYLNRILLIRPATVVKTFSFGWILWLCLLSNWRYIQIIVKILSIICGLYYFHRLLALVNQKPYNKSLLTSFSRPERERISLFRTVQKPQANTFPYRPRTRLIDLYYNKIVKYLEQSYLFSTLTCISEPCFTFTEISTSNLCTGKNSHKIFCRRLELINDQSFVNCCVYLETRSIFGLRNTNCVVFYNTILFVFRRFLPGSRKRRRALCNDWNFAWRTTWS